MIQFIYLGNLLIEKGPLVLLDACRILKDRHIPFHCHLVGAPTAEISILDVKKIVEEYGLSDSISIHGSRYGEEKERILQQADVMVFPTFYHNECFPLVLLEGMKHALVPISTGEGATPDIITDGESGILVERKNAEDLAKAMEVLITDSGLLNKLAKSAHLRYMQLFTKSQFISRLQQILRES